MAQDESCPTCSGTGNAVCPVCRNYRPSGSRGNSVMPDGRGGTTKCTNCDGRGYAFGTKCPTCRGSGVKS
jgi:DnaJ-class molecular chaperone